MFKIFKKYEYKNFQKKIFKEKNIKLGSRVKIKNTILMGYNKIGSDTSLNNSLLEIGSYCGANCHLENVKISKYVSIASNVDIINGNHPTRDFVTSHPFAYTNTLKEIGFNFLKNETCKINKTIQENYTVIIGNDVWIGENVKILNGIKIGNGAIIGTGAVVVKDVLPYTIVGGIPAKIIRYRFNEDEIKFLEKFKWWDKDIKWIKENVEIFNNIEIFMKNYN